MRVGACGGGRGKGREEGEVGEVKERRGRGICSAELLEAFLFACLPVCFQ